MMGVGTRQFRPGPEWLSPLDLSNLRTEDQGLRMHVAALAVLDAERLLNSAEKLRLRDIRADVELERGRAASFARSHTIAIRPRPLPSGPVTPTFDIALHVNARSVRETRQPSSPSAPN